MLRPFTAVKQYDLYALPIFGDLTVVYAVTKTEIAHRILLMLDIRFKAMPA